MSTEAAAPTSAETTPSAPAPVTATPVTPAAPVTAATPQVTPPASATPSAPEGWVPSYRLREAREAAQRESQTAAAQERAQWEAKYNQIQAQLHALVGVQPPSNPEQDAIKQQFYGLFPKLKALEEQADDLSALRDRAGDLEAQTNHYWQNYGKTSMDRLFAHAAESLGAPLTDEGKRALHSSFVGFVQSSPEMTSRYANDPTIIEDFWKAFTSNFIDPARRVASATVAGRATTATPQDTPGGVPRVTPGPKPANMDERAASAWALYQQNAGTKT